MKEGIHPDYHKVVFVDSATGHEWFSRSTMKSSDMREIDGQQVPFYSDALRHPVALRVTTRAIRTVQKHGGIDRFLVDMDAAKLGPVGQKLKRRVHKAMGGLPGPR